MCSAAISWAYLLCAKYRITCWEHKDYAVPPCPVGVQASGSLQSDTWVTCCTWQSFVCVHAGLICHWGGSFSCQGAPVALLLFPWRAFLSSFSGFAFASLRCHVHLPWEEERGTVKPFSTALMNVPKSSFKLWMQIILWYIFIQSSLISCPWLSRVLYYNPVGLLCALFSPLWAFMLFALSGVLFPFLPCLLPQLQCSWDKHNLIKRQTYANMLSWLMACAVIEAWTECWDAQNDGV